MSQARTKEAEVIIRRMARFNKRALPGETRARACVCVCVCVCEGGMCV